MPPKKNKKKGGAKAKAVVEDDDDWEAALTELGSPKASEEPKAEEEEVAAPEVAGEAPKDAAEDAAAAFLAKMGGGGGGGGGGGDDDEESTAAKNKKKKAKKKAKKKEEPKKESAAGKKIREQQEKLNAEREAVEAEEAEKRRIFEAEENERQAALKVIQDKKDAKKKRAADKVLQEKADGTYRTKKEKERDAKAESARLAFEKSGAVAGGGGGGEKKKVVYSNKKKQQKKKVESEDEEETQEAAAPPPAPEAEAAESSDDGNWDDSGDDDDGLNLNLADDDEEEDETVKEQRIETERLRKQEIARREKAAVDAKKQKFSDDIAEQKKEEARIRREEREAAEEAARSKEKLRSPICCIMGHVDVGKTKLLDKIRNTNVQLGEAGGITQQIGATFFPVENVKKQTAKLNETFGLEYKLPGLLIIDTPGHESFTNLRSRGSSLCDIAILVIDIMHGLEPQTLESLNLLRSKKAPFVVALNKVDRLYDWKVCKDEPIRDALKKQKDHVVSEFHDRTKGIIAELQEQGLNSALYYENTSTKDLIERVSIVPTSGISGEGIPDMLLLLVQLTQTMMAEALMFSATLQCTILEVKVIEGLGTTIDCILVNGVLKEGDEMVVCTVNGPVVTSIRSLLTPYPMKEMRVKGEYVHHTVLEAAMGVKITAQQLEHAIAGTSIKVIGPDDDVEDMKEQAMADIEDIMDSIPHNQFGVHVQASTLGALEALLEFLKHPSGAHGDLDEIPVSGISIGPVHKKDVLKASMQLDHKKEYATILAFDVRVTAEAKDLAEKMGVRIFTADIIYHLFDHVRSRQIDKKPLG
jgi:translation initiation factor 5B